MRARVACLTVVALVVASCGTPSPSTSPGPPTASPVASAPTASPSPAASPSPPVIGYWERADTMSVGRGAPHAVALGDGSVLVVGNDDVHRGLGFGMHPSDCVRDNSVITELWDPSTATWRATPGLNNPRADFVAVPLGDSALVTGGVNPGITHELGYQNGHQSYSSTYIYDPAARDVWTKAALLGIARTDPIAAVLADGRVLVAGGYYLSGTTGQVDPGPVSALADSRLAPNIAMPEVILADAVEMPRVAALAKAELYDRATDRWTPTGPMRYARHGAAAVTLSDGRVLVVGSSLDYWAAYWNGLRVTVDERVYDTAEIYDPTSGRFELTGEIAPIDRSALAELGLSLTLGELVGNGTLVALADGGALLVGRTTTWFADPGFNEGYLVRTLRFDPASGRWNEIDGSYAWVSGAEEVGEIVTGHVSHNAVAATLADGRVLVAGGEQATCGADGSCGDTYVAVESASLYDPANDTWLPLPPMPEPRAGGTLVVLADGSVLIVGGYTENTPSNGLCGWDATGLASTVRFVPLPAPTTRVPLSGAGTAVIDGTLSPGEWADAARVDLVARVPPLDSYMTAPASLLVMNDGENLYLAVTVKGTYSLVSSGFEFDGDDDGSTFEVGEDFAGAYLNAGDGGWIPVSDGFRLRCPGDTPGTCGVSDTSVGAAYPSPGTVDGSAAGGATRGWSVVEISRPLASGDVGRDFQLDPGDTIGLALTVDLWTCGGDRTPECAAETYLPIDQGQVLRVRIEDVR